MENLTNLFKILMIDRSKDLKDIDISKKSEIINMIRILP